jgi:putative phage-type endonuclease
MDDVSDLRASLVSIIETSLALTLASPKCEQVLRMELLASHEELVEDGAIDEEALLFEIEMAIAAYVGGIVPPRCRPWSPRCRRDMTSRASQLITEQQSGHEQRTEGWFEERRGMITASGASGLLGTDARWRALVWEKAGPIASRSGGGSVESAAHWGQRYEPVAAALYEMMSGAAVHDVGCVRHPTHTFIGASPDGIVPGAGGKLLEIKCVVSRIIDGIPTLAYWVQMQWQMACTGLREVDFLECRFSEYESEEAFCGDGGWGAADKGVLHQFHGEDGAFYEYAPLGITESGFEAWTAAMLGKHATATWVVARFWRLDQKSCVTVDKNDAWFESVLGRARRLWRDVEEARESCAEAYRPAARTKRERRVEAFAVDTQTFMDICEQNEG